MTHHIFMLEKHSPNPPKQPKIAAATTSAQTIGTLAQFASQKIRYLMNIPTYFISVLIFIQITDRARKYCENIAVFSKVYQKK